MPSYSEEDEDTHVSPFVYIEITTKPSAKIKQVPFKSVPKVKHTHSLFTLQICSEWDRISSI